VCFLIEADTAATEKAPLHGIKVLDLSRSADECISACSGNMTRDSACHCS